MNKSRIQSLKSKYQNAKSAKVGDMCKCPSCGEKFVKDNHQQAFCKTRPGTKCKDYYWNNVTPDKRNNKTRISPASAAYMNEMRERRSRDFDPEDDIHPHDPDALGQWND